VRDRQGLETARHHLVESLVNYSATEGLNTRVVFDAQFQKSAVSTEVITQNLSVHYTDFGQTADTYIEKVCAALSRSKPDKLRVIVATSDRVHQLTVVGYGAEWMSAQQLALAVNAAARRIRHQQSSQPRSPQRLLMNQLDPVAQERLAQLRLGLH
jgi:hypothetical protein